MNEAIAAQAAVAFGSTTPAAYLQATPDSYLAQATVNPGGAVAPDALAVYGQSYPYMGSPHASPGHTQRLQVYREDCIVDCKGQLRLPASPSRALAVGAKALQDAPIHREVYVQHMVDAERFRPVPVQRMKSAFGNVKRAEEPQRASAQVLSLWSACAELDPASTQLQIRDRVDVDILELLAGGEECQISAAAAFLTIQALMAGLSLATGLVVFGARGTVELELILKVIQPGFACLNLIFAEISCVGNGLRFLRAWDKVVVWKAGSLEDSGNTAEARVEREEGTRRDVFHKAGMSTVRLATNASFLICCLLSSRGNMLLLHGGEWPGDFAHGLLLAQACLGLLALAFAGSDLSDLMSPKLASSSSSGTPLVDDSQVLQSSTLWPQA